MASIVQTFFLESLAFTTMNDREDEIQEAHTATFDWIFNSNETADAGDHILPQVKNNFNDWLLGKNESNVFWINGKPGSGKSTLVRYIFENTKTIEQLKSWAAEKPLLLVRFFFWTSGTIEQRSHAGLLRALLHQLLEQRRDSIPWIFPEMWLKYQDTKLRATATIPWSVEMMMPALQKFLELVAGELKICFFIDGLDELEGDQLKMVQMLQHIVHSSPDFKACVSSRPWKVFNESFADVPQLKLQELNQEDILQYVDNDLEGAPKMRRILKKEPEQAEALKKQMTENADGVFLWATLATKTLIERTNGGDTVADLLVKLATFPVDLGDLYRHLLFESKTSEELQQQSRIFQTLRAREDICDFTRDESSNSVTLYQLALADEGETIVITDVAQPGDEAVIELCESMKNVLHDLCADLIQAHQSNERRNGNRSRARFGDTVSAETLARSRIGYLHRTVRDFLRHAGGLEHMIKHSGDSFDPHIAMLRSHVLLLRLPLEYPERHRRLDEWWTDVVSAMTHAKFSSEKSISLQVELLDHFKDSLDWYWHPKKDPLDNWARNAFSSYEIRMKHRTPYHYPFLSLSAKFGLDQYLDAELQTGKYPYQGGIPILSHALEHLVNRRKTVYPLAEPKLIEMLLRNGEDPNIVYKPLIGPDETPWLLALKYVREADRRDWIQKSDKSDSGIKRWVSIMKILLNHGADPNGLIVADKWDPAASALDVVTMVKDKYDSADIQELFDLLVKKGASLRAVDV
ncbi:hypothetical protein BT63DRAFT_370026 [Microthyrium microscopicum]|uniref:Uncharacterized protein n=1 Tax=Microthyrium microscopicum TaxID=703497 RepID=A0A6A6UMZ8_9PEZI|nr:hypothetical protein BT63DRAFT_370026 [Microthyrium microscopicum]